MKLLKNTVLMSLIALSGATSVYAADSHPVIEVVTLKIKPGVSFEEFKKIDKAVEDQHVSKQPGFISRESAAGQNQEWLVIVHWRSVEDADASMNSFTSAPAAGKFMQSIDSASMKMTRYQAP
ncbi:antibiotic biosynthesis monooxygenase family protein [Serratia plymuthica]|uniref:ABM domain-containing protein n=1 Tax=Serratia plymuthica TaxID=82996 RepID=A0A2X4UIL7_SERPL|nr:antibiotic biosynthesis monooxygenase [Serratia plymuthica]QPS21874.1 hypothetical protein I6G64_05505 [Serratia plymuthica]QPS54766.1 hypothetical protein I6G53_19105 [Serratia plymuthica]QPS63485.1 hypothetical protein I6G52_01295 [Serratia plymuthica]RKS64155.1 hypothetical protein C8E17_3470 [Serratia plymuthica]UNK26908.1 antibiotic biosynthesis monooxygenase [Serratia plymuthica]